MRDTRLLSASDIACIRGGRLIFAGIGLTLDRGQSLLVRGPNGAGKSSLLRLLAGLLPCSHGELHRHTSTALADEHLALDTNMRLSDALRLWMVMDGSSADRLCDALHHFSLDHLADIPVRMLSTGQRKRAILARTYASCADIWLLDEPGNGLDAASLSALGEAMNAHVAAGGGIIAASHFDLPHAFTQMVDLERSPAP